MAWLLAKETKSVAGIKAREMEECLNCKKGLDPEITFCPICGQKTHETKLTLWSLLGDFFGSLFNIENGIYRSFISLPIPGFLSKQFISGKRKSYLNPVRLFLITLILHLTVLTNLVPFDYISTLNTKLHEEIGQKKIAAKFEEIGTSSQVLIGACDMDTLSSILFEDIEIGRDSSYYPSFEPTKKLHSDVIGEYRIAIADIYEMPVEELFTKYGIVNYWEKTIGQQIIRTMRDPPGAIRFGVGNLIWSILSTIILTGLFMKLIYIRRRRFFVEHLIVLFNIHSFCFLVASAGFWYNTNNDLVNGNFQMSPGLIPGIIITLFFFLSMKFYYKQGWIKTFIKFGMVGFIYFILLSAMISIVTIISLFFFS